MTAVSAMAEWDEAEGVPEEELFRARVYGLLSRVLAGPPDAALLSQLRGLRGDDTEIGRAVEALSRAAAATTPDRSADEYHALFVGLTRGEFMPYASYYLTGFLHEKPLAALRRDLAALEVARAADVSEPEDHAAALCEVMAGLIDGMYGMPQALPVQRRFFEAHLAPWIGRLFADLAGAKAAVFYRAVGELGRRFIDIERAAFAMDG